MLTFRVLVPKDVDKRQLRPPPEVLMLAWVTDSLQSTPGNLKESANSRLTCGYTCVHKFLILENEPARVHNNNGVAGDSGRLSPDFFTLEHFRVHALKEHRKSI